jgi:hypothetical protein
MEGDGLYGLTETRAGNSIRNLRSGWGYKRAAWSRARYPLAVLAESGQTQGESHDS